MNTTKMLPTAARNWLQGFARCVRDRTYDTARPLFHTEVYSFGTVAYSASGLDDLVSHQWREVWDVTEGFDFDYDGARSWESDTLLCVAVPWSSKGFDESGRPFERRGRSTLTLARIADDWKAVHTHFSMEPDVNPAP